MYYTLEKTAEILGLQPGDVNRLREQGKLRAFRDGSAWKFRKEDVDKFLTESIKERSKTASSGLLNDSDDELPTMLADSSSFDSMLDASAENFVINNDASVDVQIENDDFGLSLAKEDDDLGLSLAKEDDDLGLSLAKEDDEAGLSLAKDDDEAGLSLAKDDDDSANALETSSDDDLLHLGSDSGLSLLDDISGIDGSNVSLGDDDDVVLGGSGSGSGSALNLAGDSGLALLDDSAEDFALDGAVAQQDDDSIFDLAEEPKPDAVLELEKNVDSDTATILSSDESEDFQLDTDVSGESSDSDSESQIIPIEGDESSLIFTTETSDSTANTSDFFSVDDSKTEMPFISDVSGSSVDPFGPPVDETPFGVLPQEETLFGGSPKPEESSLGTFDPQPEVTTIESGVGTPKQEVKFTGAEIGLFLVPCLLCLILATIGAYELTRTIWSYESQSFDVAGPVLETIAKTLSLIK